MYTRDGAAFDLRSRMAFATCCAACVVGPLSNLKLEVCRLDFPALVTRWLTMTSVQVSSGLVCTRGCNPPVWCSEVCRPRMSDGLNLLIAGGGAFHFECINERPERQRRTYG